MRSKLRICQSGAKQGNSIHISTVEGAQAAFRSELAKYAATVKKIGLEPQ